MLKKMTLVLSTLTLAMSISCGSKKSSSTPPAPAKNPKAAALGWTQFEVDSIRDACIEDYQSNRNIKDINGFCTCTTDAMSQSHTKSEIQSMSDQEAINLLTPCATKDKAK